MARMARPSPVARSVQVRCCSVRGVRSFSIEPCSAYSESIPSFNCFQWLKSSCHSTRIGFTIDFHYCWAFACTWASRSSSGSQVLASASHSYHSLLCELVSAGLMLCWLYSAGHHQSSLRNIVQARHQDFVYYHSLNAGCFVTSGA